MSTVINIPVVNGWCEYCDEEHGWYDAVHAALEGEFPPNLARTWPADHPYWVRLKELESQYLQPTVDFSYDDRQRFICAKHLREIAFLVEAT